MNISISSLCADGISVEPKRKRRLPQGQPDEAAETKGGSHLFLAVGIQNLCPISQVDWRQLQTWQKGKLGVQ